jgi:hypothetical protein
MAFFFTTPFLAATFFVAALFIAPFLAAAFLRVPVPRFVLIAMRLD